MNKELEIWRFAAERLQRNDSVMLLVVAESSGSSPGRRGFKMVVAKDEMRGSIGGGVMEMRLVEQAGRALNDERLRFETKIVEQVHQKNSPNSSGMICSGKQKVILRKLTKNDFKVVRKIIRHSERNEERFLQISEDKFRVGWHKRSNFDFRFTVNNPHALETQIRLIPTFADENSTEKALAASIFNTDASEIFTFLYEEKLNCKNELFIIGGGHCALALSEVMAKMDFYISLFDDRPNLNTIDKNEFADRKIILENYEEIGDYIESGTDVYVVVMTIGYQSDAAVIKKLIDKDFKYFGVLGSRAKMATLLRELKNEGFAAEKLNRIRTPIGIEINSRTPEEIAVSIAAEIIAVKNSAR